MTLDALLAKFEARKKTGPGWMVRCPSHADTTASLAISQGHTGKIVLHCHAGCETASILASVGLTMADLRDEGIRPSHHTPIAVFDYHDESGTVLYQVVRYPNKPDGTKDFSQRRPDGRGGWIYKLDQTRRVLYRLPKLKGHQAVVIVEGEKDADRLWSLGIPATTNSGGAGQWHDHYASLLTAAGVKRVAVLPDNDAPGERHAKQVGASCYAARMLVKVLPLPDLPPKGDVSDWLNNGGNRDTLLAMIRAAPPFIPTNRLTAAPLRQHYGCIGDLLAMPDIEVDWLVENRIPCGGLILLAGPPKVGKSTLTRALALAIAQGQPWLGYPTKQGSVFYSAFEDAQNEVVRHFRALGAKAGDPLYLRCLPAGPEFWPRLHELCEQERPAIVFLDTLQRAIQAEDMSNYAEICVKMEPALTICRETGVCICANHHANKYGTDMNAVLGSVALSGSVDNVFLYTRHGPARSLRSWQRVGPSLEPVMITYDPTSGQVLAAGSQDDYDLTDCRALILDVLGDETAPQTERWIRDQVDRRPELQARALRSLWHDRKVFRTGAGKRNDPYRYGRPDRCP